MNNSNKNFRKLIIFLAILNLSFCSSLTCSENCKICSSVDNCIECEIGYYVHPYLQQCLPCASNCATCAGNRPFECLSCRDKFYKKQYILPSNNNCKSGIPVKDNLTPIVQISINDISMGYAMQASFSSDGRYFTMAETTNTLKLYNQQTGDFKEIKTIEYDSSSIVNGVIFSENGKYLAVYIFNLVKIYNAEDASIGNLQLVKTIEDVKGNIAFSPDGRYVAYGVKSGVCKIFNAMTGNFEFITEVECPFPYREIAFSQNGRFLVICSETSLCNVLTSDKGIFNKKISLAQQSIKPVFSIDFSRDGQYMTLVGYYDACWIYKIEGENISYLQTISNKTYKAAFSMDSQFLAVNSFENSTTFIYNISNGIFTLFHTLSGTDITYLAFSPNGKYFADCQSTYCSIFSFCTE